jgi:hypothetical protein
LIRVIYISWRKQAGDRRYIIAKIKRNVSEGISFEYLKGYADAKKDGLEHFLGFKDSQKLTPESIEHLLALRVISKERPDRNGYLSFWEAENVSDNFDILALTQGKTQTDNFEFLADYQPKKGLKFVTDLANLSRLKLPAKTLSKGDILTYKLEKGNLFDKDAVCIYKGNLPVGYIKKIHSRVFHRTRKTLKITVKAVDENGITKQVFVKVESEV